MPAETGRAVKLPEPSDPSWTPRASSTWNRHHPWPSTFLSTHFHVCSASSSQVPEATNRQQCCELFNTGPQPLQGGNSYFRAVKFANNGTYPLKMLHCNCLSLTVDCSLCTAEPGLATSYKPTTHVPPPQKSADTLQTLGLASLLHKAHWSSRSQGEKPSVEAHGGSSLPRLRPHCLQKVGLRSGVTNALFTVSYPWLLHLPRDSELSGSGGCATWGSSGALPLAEMRDPECPPAGILMAHKATSWKDSPTPLTVFMSCRALDLASRRGVLLADTHWSSLLGQ